MSAITRFNPFRSAARFYPPALFDDFFANATLPAFWRDPTLAIDMRVDITEGADAFQIKAEIPGVNKDDIEVSVHGSQVSISAEVKRHSEKRDEKELVSERSWGRAYRAFVLPGDVDDARTEARYDNGVLTLTLPKKQAGNAHRIAVD